MVDALSEIRRCLVPGGTVVDMRPVAWQSPIEAVTGARAVPVGDFSENGMNADDIAADAAMATAVARGWFVPRNEVRFAFNFYWDSVADLSTYLEGSRRGQLVIPPASDIERRFARASEGGNARLRCNRRILLATYRTRKPQAQEEHA
jgi:hypothetical protein